MELQQVVRDQNHGNLGQNCRTEPFSTDATLELCERERASIEPRHDLAIDDGTVRQQRGGGVELGEAVSHQLITTRPDEGSVAAPYHLRADAIPLPLGLPQAWLAERLQVLVQCVREKKGIG